MTKPQYFVIPKDETTFFVTERSISASPQVITGRVSEQIAEYTNLGLKSHTTILEARKVVDHDRLIEYVPLDITNPKFIKCCEELKLRPSTIREYSNLGFSVETALTLFGNKVTPENAQVGAHFGWKVNTMCNLPSFVFSLARNFMKA